MNNSILTEAFKKLDILEEEDFNLGSDSQIKDAKEFIENEDEDNTLDVIDIQAEDEEQLADSYIGKAILECVVCHSNIFKDASDVTINEEEQVANIDEECPYCFSTDGFKVIGQIAPFGEVEEQIEVKEEELPEEDVDLDNEFEDDFNSEDDLEDDLEESLNECGNMSNDDYTENEALKEEVNCPKCGKNPCECEGEEDELEEDFKDVSITTDDSRMEMTSDDNGKVTVTTEPLDAEFDDDFGMDVETDDEMLAPLTDDTIEEIADNQDVDVEDDLGMEDEMPMDDYDDVDVEEFDEETFDELGESYLKRVYENVNSFKTTAVKESKNKLKLEGLINFKSGSTKKTSFIFEAKDITKRGKLRFIGENKEITRGKKAFTISGKLDGKKFVCESFNYNYQAKDQNGKSTRLYGTIKIK